MGIKQDMALAQEDALLAASLLQGIVEEDRFPTLEELEEIEGCLSQALQDVAEHITW